MRERRRTGLRLDALTIISVFLFAVYVLLSVAWCKRYRPGHLLWFCDIALLLTAVGLFFRNATLVTAQLVAILVFHLAWNLDFWLFLLLGYMPFGSTAYMFYHDLSVLEKSFSFFSHVFVIPAALYGLYVLGVSRRAWLMQSGQTILIFFLTYVLTRPEENINWMFGADFLRVTPSTVHPVFYYSLMAIVPAVIVYLPTNRLLITLVALSKRSKSDNENFGPGRASIAATRPRNRRALALVVIGIMLASATSAAIAQIADSKCTLDPALFEATSDGPTRFEIQQVGVTTAVDQIQFGEEYNGRRIPLLVWPHPLLPKQWSGRDQKLHAHTKSVLLEISVNDLPSAPQEVLLSGRRSVPRSVVWAYVASDDFYVQSHPDLHGERDRYEVRCKIGGRGLSEYVDAATGQIIPSTAYNEILGGGIGAIYALGAVEVRYGKIVAKSSYYLVKRTGIRFPEDIWLIPKKDGLTPLLSNPSDPLNSRIAFQSPLNSETGPPEVYSSDFLGYELRNLSKNPDGFDGFISPNGEALESVGWLDDDILKYYTDQAGKLVQLRIKDKR